MPIGILVNTCAIVLGGLLGSVVGDKISEQFKQTLTMVFGFCAMAMGITSVILMNNMPAVVLSVILGAIIGLLISLDGLIRSASEKALKAIHLGDNIDSDLMLTAIVLFCASGTGIYGSLVSGISGDHSILLVCTFCHC